MHTRQVVVTLGVSVASTLVVMGCAGPGDPVREKWETRDQLASCGELLLGQGEALTDVARDQIDCLRRAHRTDVGGELTVTNYTTEGDPVTTYYRVRPDGASEQYTDSTQDSFGSETWSYSRCRQPPIGAEDELPTSCQPTDDK